MELDRGAITLFRVRGIPIRAHWTLFLILPYIAIVFSVGFADVARTAGVPPEQLWIPPLVWGAFLAIALFASVVVHELAHTLVAIRSGGRVRAITLMMLGGVSQVERMPPGATRQVVMAAAGPLSSIAIGLLLFLVRASFESARPDVRMALFYLAQINVVLGLFNLLPAFPMDGGRILRGVLATRLGAIRAASIASTVGRVVAVLMGLAGVLAGNLFLVLVAVYVYSGAKHEGDLERIHEVLAELSIADLMSNRPGVVDFGTSLSDIPARMRDAGRLALVVLDDHSRPAGVLRVADLADFPDELRALATVRDLRDRLSTSMLLVAPEENAGEALARASTAGAGFLVVVDAPASERPRVLGVVGPAEVETAVALRTLPLRPWSIRRVRPRRV